MLPCQDSCPDYQTGLPQAVPALAGIPTAPADPAGQKTTYLRFYRELCGTIARQLRARHRPVFPCGEALKRYK